MAVNALRSIGQGVMVVDLALYLHALGWQAVAIGGAITAGGLLSVGLVIFVGVFSDRFGRKPFILFFEGVTAGCALIGLLSTNAILLFFAIALSGFGKAEAGSASPCAPAEQAWLASFIPAHERGKIYSINNALSFFGMGFGAVLAGLTALWEPWLPGVLSYQSLFGLILVLSLVIIAIILTIKDDVEKKVLEKPSIIQERKISRQENLVVMKLASINMINGFAIGLTGPMMSYWFAAKFGASGTLIGSSLALTFFATGVTSILQASLSKRHGTIRSVVWIRVLASFLVVLLPVLPTYALASLAYLARTALNRGTQGAQQALSVSLTRDRRRGFASSINTLSMRMPMAIGPSISGYLFGLGSLSLPFFIAAGLQFGFAYLYGKTFRSFDLQMKSQSSLS